MPVALSHASSVDRPDPQNLDFNDIPPPRRCEEPDEMSSASSEVIQRAERIQEKALRKQDHDPVSIAQRIADLNSQSGPSRLFRPAIDAAEAMSSLFNEIAYDDTAAFLTYHRSPSLTRYDKAAFLQRFTNISALCHSYFKERAASAEPVWLSTLPLTQVGGFCVRVTGQENVIFLNEGLLYYAPALISRFRNIDFDEDAQRRITDGSVTDEYYETLNGAIEDFLLLFLYFFSNATTPNSLLEDGSEFLPHAHESWRLSQQLRQGLRKQGSPSESESVSGLDSADQEKQLLYYTMRGFFIFILAHEFSHHFRRHLDLKVEDGPYSDLDRLEQVLELVRATIPGRENATLAEVVNPYYAFYQKLENHADCDALRILHRYCLDHRLGGAQLGAVIDGAVLSMVLSEFLERFESAKKIGIEKTSILLQRSSLEANVFYRGTHPRSDSRLLFTHGALQNELPEDFRNRLEAAIFRQDSKMNFTWQFFAPGLDKILGSIRISPMIELESVELFRGYNAVGHMVERNGAI